MIAKMASGATPAEVVAVEDELYGNGFLSQGLRALFGRGAEEDLFQEI